MDDILYLAGAVTGLAAAGAILCGMLGWAKKIAEGARCRV